MRFAHWGQLLIRHARRFWDSDPLTLAASIAFYTSLSFAPLIMLALWSISQLGTGQEAALLAQLQGLFGSHVAEIADTVVEQAEQGASKYAEPGLLALAALLISSTTAFAQLQAALNRIWGVQKPGRNAVLAWLTRRLFSLGMIAVIGFLLMVTLVVTSVLSLVLTREGSVWLIVNELLVIAVLAFGFTALFRFVADAKPSWTDAGIAGVCTALLFQLGKWLLGLYLANMSTGVAYGAANSLLLLLIWVYYSALIVLLGSSLVDLIRDCRDPDACIAADS